MRTYRHFRPRLLQAQWMFPIVYALAATLGIGFLMARSHDQKLLPLLVMSWVVAAVASANGARVPVEVQLEDRAVTFEAPLRRTRVEILDIRSIEASALQQPALVVTWSSGQLALDPRITGLHELVTELKRRNPGITLNGI